MSDIEGAPTAPEYLLTENVCLHAQVVALQAENARLRAKFVDLLQDRDKQIEELEVACGRIVLAEVIE
jgi:hypothetical protein